MEIIRKPFQGVGNIIRFNWHFYVLSLFSIIIIFFIARSVDSYVKILLYSGALAGMLIIASSLIVSFYVYDLSSLYKLNWLKLGSQSEVLTINAGFDETSKIIRNKFPDVRLVMCDFYDPVSHTEISIERARKAYSQIPGTVQIKTSQLPFVDQQFDKVLAILSAHEIRNDDERIRFFRELRRITKTSGEILVTEHLRDVNNFLAYTLGFFHFHSRKTWSDTFLKAELVIKKEIKITPFISTFILGRDGDTL